MSAHADEVRAALDPAATYEAAARTAARYLRAQADYREAQHMTPVVCLSLDYARAVAAMLEWYDAELRRVTTRWEDLP